MRERCYLALSDMQWNSEILGGNENTISDRLESFNTPVMEKVFDRIC